MYVCVLSSRAKRTTMVRRKGEQCTQDLLLESQKKKEISRIFPFHDLRGLLEVDVYKCLWEVIKGTA